MCHMSGSELVKQGEPSGAHVDMWHLLIGWKSKVDGNPKYMDKEGKEILSTNGRLTCGKREDPILTPLFSQMVWEGN